MRRILLTKVTGSSEHALEQAIGTEALKGLHVGSDSRDVDSAHLVSHEEVSKHIADSFLQFQDGRQHRTLDSRKAA